MVAMSIGICMDAMIVSMCKGLVLKDITIRSAVIVGLWFGIFHGIMPVIGYLIGRRSTISYRRSITGSSSPSSATSG